MTWVRFDDSFPLHRKVAPLDDATYRLHTEAVAWCSRNLTDGRIAADELRTISTRATVQRVAKLISRGLWHAAGQSPCPSDKCPPEGPDGWVVHDYLEYQFSKEKIKKELAAKAERTRRWREARGRGDPVRDPVGDASHGPSPNGHESITRRVSDASPYPSRPAPKEGGAGGTSPHSDAGRQRADGTAGIERSTTVAARRCSECGNALDSAYHLGPCTRLKTKIRDDD